MNVVHDKPLKAFHCYWGEGNRAKITFAVKVCVLRHWNYGGTFKTGGHYSLAEGGVKISIKTSFNWFAQLFRTRPGTPDCWLVQGPSEGLSLGRLSSHTQQTAAVPGRWVMVSAFVHP